MTINRTTSAAATALVLTISLAAAGCGKYSFAALKAKKAYKDGNDRYRAQDYKAAAAKYEQALQSDPNKSEIFFYLGNSYDNLYKASRKGEAENDAYIQKAVDNYQKAADNDHQSPTDEEAGARIPRLPPTARDKLNDPAKAEPIVQKMIAARAERADQLLRAREDLRGRRPLRRGRAGAHQGAGTQSRTTRPSTRRSPASTTARETSPRRSRRSTRRRRWRPTIHRATSSLRRTTGRRPRRTTGSPTPRKRSTSKRGSRT